MKQAHVAPKTPPTPSPGREEHIFFTDEKLFTVEQVYIHQNESCPHRFLARWPKSGVYHGLGAELSRVGKKEKKDFILYQKHFVIKQNKLTVATDFTSK